VRLAIALLILGFLALAVQVWGLIAPGPANWGIHQYGFLPQSWLAAGFVIGLLVFALAQGSLRSLAGLGRRPAIWMPLTAAVAGGVFWLGRERSHFLGDGLVWARAIGEGRLLGHNEPAASWGLYFLHRVAGRPDPVALLAVASVVCGAVFVLLALLFARSASRDAGGAGLVFGLVVLSGFTRLFYGHIESYAVGAVVLLAYLLLATRHLQGRVGLWAPALLLAACIPTHVVAVMLLPSWAYLLWRSPEPAWRRAAWGAGALALAAAGLQAGWHDLRAAGVVFSGLLTQLLPLGGDLGIRIPYHVLDAGHVRDFVQEQLLLGPLTAAAALLLWAARRGRERDETFLLWAGIPWWILSFLFSREIGAARDWGAFALASVPLALFAGTALARHPWRREAGGVAPAAAGLILAVTALHTVGLVGVDLDPDRGLQRFAGLFGPAAPVSGFARSYAFEEIGNHYLAAGDFGNAEVAYSAAVQADSTNTRLAGNLGSVRLLAGNRKGAVDDLEAAVKRNPGNAVLNYQLAGAYVEVGRLDEAAVSFRKAIDHDPNLLDAYLAYASLARRLGDVALADTLLTHAERRFPASGEVKLNLAEVYEQSSRTDEAIAKYREGLALTPDDNAAAFNLARLYMNHGNPGDATQVLRDLLQRDPSDVEAWINLGGALDGVGDKEGSLEAFRQANRLPPARPEPYFNLARAYMLQSEPDVAIRLLSRYAAIDSTSEAGLRARALIRRLLADAAAADTTR